MRDKKAIVGAAVLVVFTLIAIVGPLGFPDAAAPVGRPLAPPSWAHWLGTTGQGQDVLALTVTGARGTLAIAFAVGALVVLLGALVGVTAGYFGGRIDRVLVLIMDALFAFPYLLLAIVVAFLLADRFGRGIGTAALAISVVYIPQYFRVVRNHVISVREESYVEAARALGASGGRIMLAHILPNVAAPIIVQATFAVGLGILAESALTFIGLGVNPSTPTWGMSLNEGRDFIRQAWWISVFPGLAIVFTVLALNLFGDGLRDALDVKSVRDGG